jgi:hypothetical protein
MISTQEIEPLDPLSFSFLPFLYFFILLFYQRGKKMPLSTSLDKHVDK